MFRAKRPDHRVEMLAYIVLDQIGSRWFYCDEILGNGYTLGEIQNILGKNVGEYDRFVLERRREGIRYMFRVLSRKER